MKALEYVLVVGAKSDIGFALARHYAAHGFSLYLAARSSVDLNTRAASLRKEYGIDVKTIEFDVLQFNQFYKIYSHLSPEPLGVITAVGYLGNQFKAERDIIEAQKIVDTNFTGLALFLGLVAEDFSLRRKGFIIGISSVAGVRGRKTNYYYGSAKAGLTAFLSGLRNRLYNSDVQVLTVQLGFVRSKMTEGMRLPGFLVLSTEEAALAIFNAQQKGKDVVYVSPLWRWVVLLIRILPEWLFKRFDWKG